MKKLSVVTSSLLLAACGGGGDSDGNNPGIPQPVEVQQGIFLDAPVQNLDYRNTTGTRSGVTGAAGEFDFFPGDAMEFAIGALTFRAVNACEVITPMELAGIEGFTFPGVNNIVRLLMTLDKDANPGNGIEITETAKGVATQVDFSLPSAEFANSSAVTNLIFNGGQDATVSGLVSVDAAAAHFRQSFSQNDISHCRLPVEQERVILNYMGANNIDGIRDDSGMYYQILEEGTGDSPVVSSTVTVEYKGYLLDGFVFDETPVGETRSFGLSAVIQGWRQALPLLKPGGSGIFILPSDIAYGTTGSRTIPPNTILVFEIKLVSFQ